MANEELIIGGVSVEPGNTATIEVSVAPLYTLDNQSMTVQVIRSKRPGPILLISAAVHGDEIIGVEIIRRLLQHKSLNNMRGTIIAIPIVNVYGFLHHTRYLPDGRDLNRSFPGSPKGSLTGRVANTFVTEILSKATHGIDLHSGARHRSNFPQIRADLADDTQRAMAEAFGVPLIIDSAVRDKSLRACAGELGIPVILYEAGEALRFEEMHIRAGVTGVINVMRQLGMLRPSRRTRPPRTPIISDETVWIRAPESGILRALVALGETIEKDQTIALISDPLGTTEVEVQAQMGGVVIGRTNLPLTYAGDALFHIARYGRKVGAVEKHVEEFQESHEPDADEDTSEDPSNAPIT